MEFVPFTYKQEEHALRVVNRPWFATFSYSSSKVFLWKQFGHAKTRLKTNIEQENVKDKILTEFKSRETVIYSRYKYTY